ncbi:MAG TPA: hypothetical protein VL068_03315 [Microthrixaceae bacterium]|nr:hypothetical protein [Microthrixaceae bacterium]
MPAAPSTALKLAIAVLCLLALAGCSGRIQQPRDYGEANTKGEGYFGNLMYGCTGVQPTKGKYINEKLSSAEYCRCLYDGLKESVPFAQAKSFEEAQAAAKAGSEPDVPNGIAKVQKDCKTAA